ncbi:hypothetical protein [Pseudomonas sp. R5(2019)]|uniref:hypothetical protein n=1 Tax=Pseudomonas sp. R5(2019) TaxID=2697566 RepID=UPI0014127763|nr:hypothetical protein [Pseudomonas sp. R5(2019)]NBA97236.1 hypothetical protein [Pseudomonas sp. R5(2019)]
MPTAFKGSELPPPSLPHSLHNRIGTHAAARLSIRVDPPPEHDPGDLLELFWNNRYVAAHTLASAASPVFFKVPERLIVPGAARIHYRFMKVGCCPRRSATLLAEVKLDCPGGPPLSLDDDENQALKPLVLPDSVRKRGVDSQRLNRGVPFTIEPYPNMAVDDAITLRWGDARLDLPPLQALQVGAAVCGRVPLAVIRDAGIDPHLEVSYCILDRVGNNSHWAPPRTVRVF